MEKQLKESQEKDEQMRSPSSSSSDSSDYELIANENLNDVTEKNTPVLENIVCEDLEDAIEAGGIHSSPSASNVLVGKSIFYDCLDEKSKSEKLSIADTDEGKNQLNTFKFTNLTV